MYNMQTATANRSDQVRGTATNRLVFPHGVANLTIRVDPSMATDYRGEFSGPKARVTEVDGVVTVDYPRLNPLFWSRTAADISLSPRVAWRLDIRDGVSQLIADLEEVVLAAIDVRGGVSQAVLRLPRPIGTVMLRVSGGVSRMTLHRPAGVPARVHVAGGASKLAVDDQYFGAIGGPVTLQTPDYGTVTGGYSLEIGGGASKITVDRA